MVSCTRRLFSKFKNLGGGRYENELPPKSLKFAAQHGLLPTSMAAEISAG
jgi:hypothetical protein